MCLSAAFLSYTGEESKTADKQVEWANCIPARSRKKDGCFSYALSGKYGSTRFRHVSMKVDTVWLKERKSTEKLRLWQAVNKS